jgi:hypothetical protein
MLGDATDDRFAQLILLLIVHAPIETPKDETRLKGRARSASQHGFSAG